MKVLCSLGWFLPYIITYYMFLCNYRKLYLTLFTPLQIFYPNSPTILGQVTKNKDPYAKCKEIVGKLHFSSCFITHHPVINNVQHFGTMYIWEFHFYDRQQQCFHKKNPNLLSIVYFKVYWINKNLQSSELTLQIHPECLILVASMYHIHQPAFCGMGWFLPYKMTFHMVPCDYRMLYLTLHTLVNFLSK